MALGGEKMMSGIHTSFQPTGLPMNIEKGRYHSTALFCAARPQILDTGTRLVAYLDKSSDVHYP